MTKIWVAVLFVAACGKPKHLPECDEFVATVDKIVSCKTLPASADRAQLEQARKTITGAFDMMDQAGGIEKAPKDVQENLRSTCKAQNSAIVEVYTKVAPDCLK